MTRRRQRRRVALALTGSAALHLALGAAVLWLGARAARRHAERRARPIEVEIVARSVTPALSPTLPRRAAGEGDQLPTSKTSSLTPSPSPSPSSTSSPSPSPTSSPSPSPSSSSSPAPLAGGDIPTPPPSLRPRELLDDFIERGRAPPPVDDRAPRADPAAEAAAVKSRVDGWFAEAKAVDRARAPNPWFEGVRQRLERGFRPEWDLLGGGGPASSPSPAVEQALAAWAERARAYGATGRLGGDPWRNVVTDSFDRHMSAAVLVSFDGDGAVLGVELARSSGHRSYDALALARAWALAEEAGQLGHPPGAARALYAFDAHFLLAPPLPVAGCGFDATFMPTGCTWPLKRSVSTTVELRALY